MNLVAEIARDVLAGVGALAVIATIIGGLCVWAVTGGRR